MLYYIQNLKYAYVVPVCISLLKPLAIYYSPHKLSALVLIHIQHLVFVLTSHLAVTG